MTPLQIGILATTILTFIGIGVVGVWQMTRIPWPSGPRMMRDSALGTLVTVIDAPGSDGEKLMLLDACAMATTAIFTGWHVYRPNDAAAASVFPQIGVHFIEDALMDDIQAALFPGQRVASYLSDVSTKFTRIPLAVIRKSLAKEMIATGQPLMHELVHALLTYFAPDDVEENKNHTHPAWDLVQGSARATYLDLYAPKVQVMKRP